MRLVLRNGGMNGIDMCARNIYQVITMERAVMIVMHDAEAEVGYQQQQ